MQRIIGFGKELCDGLHDQLHFAHFVAMYQLDLILFTLNCLFPHHSYYAAILRVSVKSIDLKIISILMLLNYEDNSYKF